jgi:hypothetical protein
VYAAWTDFRNGQADVYLRISDDAGATFGPEQRLTAPGADGAHPSIAASGAYVRVTWMSVRAGFAEVYTRGSSDSGVTWDGEQMVSESPYESWVATVALDGPRVYVAWVDYRDANEEEYLRVSDDFGVSWGPVTRLTDDAADSWAPSLAVDGESVHMVWFDRRDAGASDVDVENKLNEAMALVGLAPSPPPARDPAVYYLPAFTPRLQDKLAQLFAAAPAWVAGGGDPAALQALLDQYTALFAQWLTGWEVYYKRSTDRGATWGADTRLTFAANVSSRPAIVAVGGALRVVWYDGRLGDLQVFWKQSADGGLSWLPDEQLSDAVNNPIAESMRPSIAANGDSLHVVWFDQRDGNAEIYYKRRPDNCPSIANAAQTNADGLPLDNGPFAPDDDVTIVMSDMNGDACDADDDNDGISDAAETAGPPCASASAATNPLDMDTDGDHLTDGWECANATDPASASSKFYGSGSTDGDGDRVFDIAEARGYNASGSSTDSDGDGCHDMVEAYSVDGDMAVTDADRIILARRVLLIPPYVPEPAQDYAMDVDKTGVVNDADRILVARAVLLPAWVPKSCP